MKVNRLILASASPRRSELLRQAGLEFDVIPAEIDETPFKSESPDKYVLRLSLSKARKVSTDFHHVRPVIGADTVVSIDGKLLGKPADKVDALQMLQSLVGRTHLVHTGVSLVLGERRESFFTATEVNFGKVTDEELKKYIATGEPFDKAGGYAIQGRGAFLVDSISGSYTGVVGLPVAQTLLLLKSFGLWEMT